MDDERWTMGVALPNWQSGAFVFLRFSIYAVVQFVLTRFL
jgi:hypothetical protein